jgi:hypothetical protein
MAAMLPLASRPIPSETPKILCKKKKKETVKPLKLRHIENSVADISFVEDIHEEQVPAQYTTLSS